MCKMWFSRYGVDFELMSPAAAVVSGTNLITVRQSAFWHRQGKAS